ncbi:hypothetical protein D9611_000846 [Ephemerocybe angulata]|uniref:Uncharacterized protein n=1 Tax=Ephemerocybe angulata TaxID=980116 RepID=A0A8H5BLF6_9AGAR|nr:hypothetical protein D9611_000846 [Tulosesus angulatus]
MSRGNGADSNIGADFEAAFAEAEKSDVKANKCVKNISATLREKISRAERVPKWHLEFNAYPPYIPTIKTREQLEEHVFRWKLCNDDWSLAAVMVFLMKELHKNRKIGRSWTFYYNIPFAKSDFPGGGKKAIAGFDLEMTVGKLANDLVKYYGGRVSGKSGSSPLPVTALPDRKTTIFFDLRQMQTPWRQAFGNVFKVTDKLIILKAKNGNLLTPEILTKEATTSSRTSSELRIYQIGVDDGSMNFDRSTQSLSTQSSGGSCWSYGSTLRSVLSSLGNHVPDLRDISSFLERIIEVQDETEDKYHWTCSDEPPPIPEPHPQILASPTFQPGLSPGPSLDSEHPAEARSLPLPVPSFHTPKPVSQDLPTVPSTSIGIPPSTEESTILDPFPTPPTSMGPSPSPSPPPAIAAGSSLPKSTTPSSAPSEQVAAASLPHPLPPNSLPSSQQSTNVQDLGPTARPNLQGTKMRGNNAPGLSSDSNEPTFSVERRAVSYTHHAHADPPPQKLGFFGKMKKKFWG